MLLRIIYRRTSVEHGDLHEFIEAEFRDSAGNLDLQLSVYEVISSDAVKAHAEHYAGNKLGPAGRVNLDVSGLHESIRSVRGQTGFAFTEETHRELMFASPDQLTGFASRLLADCAVRGIEVTKAALKQYVVSRFHARDPEWTAFGAQATGEWRNWFDKVLP